MKHQATLETFLGRVKKLPEEPNYMWTTNRDVARESLELVMNFLKTTRRLTLHFNNGIYSPTSLSVNVAQVYVEGFTNDLVAILVPARVKDEFSEDVRWESVPASDLPDIYKDQP